MREIDIFRTAIRCAATPLQARSLLLIIMRVIVMLVSMSIVRMAIMRVAIMRVAVGVIVRSVFGRRIMHMGRFQVFETICK